MEARMEAEIERAEARYEEMRLAEIWTKLDEELPNIFNPKPYLVGGE